MSRPIVFNESVKQKILEDVAAALENYKSVDGNFSYSSKITGEGRAEGIRIAISPVAYLKMTALVQEFNSEVAWHGTVERDGDLFRITDIFVYPQEVDGASVYPDHVKYNAWIDDFEDEVFNKLHFHGHSHVNMSTSPSCTDLGFQNDVLKGLQKDGFYIFVIWNKRGEYTFRVYDLAANSLYENADIDFYVEGFDYEEVISEAKKLVNPMRAVSVAAGTKKKNKYQDHVTLHEYDSAFDYVDNDWDSYSFLRDKGAWM